VAQTIVLLGEVIDYAMRLMTTAYVSGTNLRAQTDEAFRLFSLGQDITLEREKQRAALMEWSQSVLFGLLGHQTDADSNPLSASPFGLWVRHRASVLFQGSTILAQLVKLMQEIDGNILPGDKGIKSTLVANLHRRIDEMKFLLNDLFQNAAEVENGRDPLTRTLNRRFLPSVVGREITLAKKSNTPLSILMADLDHFKSINDKHGHSAGDLALRHAAEILLNAVRPSDFVFRYGGEEFLIVLVETAQREAQFVAEHIRAQVEASPIPISDRETITATISIGVATYEGHPDYQYLINAADHALYNAKKEGRNRVATAIAA
jgi:diguanylate cyclase